MGSDNCQLEKELKNHPTAISLEQMDKIKEQMEKSVCKIICPKGGYGTGFFCKIPFPDEFNLLRVLITNNHVLGENDIIQGYKIKFTLKNDKFIFEILIDKKRKIYTNKEFDITIIEIYEKDNLEHYKLLEIDEDIFKEKLNKIFENKTIYLIHYPKGDKVKYSLGTIKNIENNTIRHLCSTETGSSGGPLINLFSFKVIGLHKIGTSFNFNLGNLIKEPLIKFKEKYNNIFDRNTNYNYISNIIVNQNNINILNYNNNGKKAFYGNQNSNNFITAEIEINEEDMNKNIRIINSYEQVERDSKGYNHYIHFFFKADSENEKELKDNCIIKINNKIMVFSYFYRFNQIGKYTIQYLFKKILSKINHMFYGCSSLKNINLSNFNT